METALRKCLRILTRWGEFDFCPHSYNVNLEKLQNLFYFIKWKRHTIFNIQVGWPPGPGLSYTFKVILLKVLCLNSPSVRNFTGYPITEFRRAHKGLTYNLKMCFLINMLFILW